MGAKSQYVNALIAGGMDYPEAVITKVKWFKRNFKMASELPFEEAMTKRLGGMQEVADAVLDAYQRPRYTLVAKDLAPGRGSNGYCVHDTTTIVLLGSLSVITFLHELGHAVTGTPDEDKARAWSICLFAKVYPIAFESLTMASNDPNEFMLVTDRTAGAFSIPAR